MKVTQPKQSSQNNQEDSNTYLFLHNSGKYARWIFKFPLGTSTAKHNFVMKLGARITYAVGQVGFKSTHNIDYYKN